MAYYTEQFYWLPAKGEYDQSVHLQVVDGWKIELDMDDCTAEKYYHCKCEPECGWKDSAMRELSLEELKQFYEAIGKAINSIEENDKRIAELNRKEDSKLERLKRLIFGD